MGPKSYDKHPRERRAEGDLRWTQRACEDGAAAGNDAATGSGWGRAPEAGRGGEGSVSWSFWREQGAADTSILAFRPPAQRESHFLV